MVFDLFRACRCGSTLASQRYRFYWDAIVWRKILRIMRRVEESTNRVGRFYLFIFSIAICLLSLLVTMTVEMVSSESLRAMFGCHEFYMQSPHAYGKHLNSNSVLGPGRRYNMSH